MHLLFAHSHRFKVDETGQVYAGGSFSNEIFARYFTACKRLTILGRREDITNNERSRHNPITLNNVRFILYDETLFDKICFPNWWRKQVKDIVKDVDGLIARGSRVGAFAIKLARQHDIPYVLEVVGSSFHANWYHGNLLGKVRAPYSFIKTRFRVKRAPNVIYVTNQYLQRLYPNNRNNISCSNVMLEKIIEEDLVSRIDKIRQKPLAAPFILGTIGKVSVNYKGFANLLKAVAEVNAQTSKQVLLRVLGEVKNSKIKKWLRRYNVENYVDFYGNIPSGEPVKEWLRDIDCYVQASKTEGLPRSVIEAMSVAAPVIGSNAGGIPELIDSKAVFNKFKWKELYNRICDIINNEEFLIELSKNNFYRSQKYHKFILDTKRGTFLQKIFKR